MYIELLGTARQTVAEKSAWSRWRIARAKQKKNLFYSQKVFLSNPKSDLNAEMQMKSHQLQSNDLRLFTKMVGPKWQNDMFSFT